MHSSAYTDRRACTETAWTGADHAEDMKLGMEEDGIWTAGEEGLPLFSLKSFSLASTVITSTLLI